MTSPLQPRGFTLLILGASLCLAACDGQSGTDNGQRAAAGDVLEGTISDEMLPLDRVRSQPPLADPEAAAEVEADGADEEESGASRPQEGAGREPVEPVG